MYLEVMFVLRDGVCVCSACFSCYGLLDLTCILREYVRMGKRRG